HASSLASFWLCGGVTGRCWRRHPALRDTLRGNTADFEALMNLAFRIGVLPLFISIAAACTSDNGPGQPAPVDAGSKEGGPSDGGPSDAPGDAADAAPSPVAAVPVTEMFRASTLSAPVDIVRDVWGNPHIYGQTLADVTFAQGYIVARD